MSGKYIICDQVNFEQAKRLAAAGDTISLHPGSGEPPRLYEVLEDGTLRRLPLVIDPRPMPS